MPFVIPVVVPFVILVVVPFVILVVVPFVIPVVMPGMRVHAALAFEDFERSRLDLVLVVSDRKRERGLPGSSLRQCGRRHVHARDLRLDGRFGAGAAWPGHGQRHAGVLDRFPVRDRGQVNLPGFLAFHARDLMRVRGEQLDLAGPLSEPPAADVRIVGRRRNFTVAPGSGATR